MMPSLRRHVPCVSLALTSFVASAGCSLDWTVQPSQDESPRSTVVETGGDPLTPPRGLAASDAGGADAGADVTSPDNCDLDRDSYSDPTKVGCTDAAGPFDCDDTDPRAHPGQSFREDVPTPALAGDWDCVNGVEKRYATKVSCELLALGACVGVEGFADDPGCGETGSFVRCEVQGVLLCVAGPASTRKQACK